MNKSKIKKQIFGHHLSKPLKISKSGKSKIKTFPLFLIVLGVIILVENLGWVNNAWSKLWPLLLIVIGISSICKSIE